MFINYFISRCDTVDEPSKIVTSRRLLRCWGQRKDT